MDSNPDFEIIQDLINESKYISGPWRYTTWKKPGKVPMVIFSEEHGNEGACPNETSISSVFTQILNKTENGNIYIENFLHADEFPSKVINYCEKPADNTTLNDLRNCMGSVKKNPVFKSRVHFIDPRVDLVAILPNGKVYDAIDMAINRLIEEEKYSTILLTLYEAFVHPLISLFPDKNVINGRLSHSISDLKSRMNQEQLYFFEKTWRKDILENINRIVNKLNGMKENNYNNSYIIEDVEYLKILYRDITNKFLDIWLLGNLFVNENDTPISTSVIYLGSLHSLNMETYFSNMGYKNETLIENKNLDSCIRTKK